MHDPRAVALGSVGEAREQAAGLGVAQMTLEAGVELGQLVGLGQRDDPVGLAHQPRQPRGQLGVVARAVAEDHAQRQAVEDLREPRPVQLAVDRQRRDLRGDRGDEALGERMHPLAPGEHVLGERAPVAPLLAARQRQRIGLEVGHALGLGTGVGGVDVSRAVEDLADRVGAPQHDHPPTEQPHALAAALRAHAGERLDGAPVGVDHGERLHRPAARREEPADDGRHDPRPQDPDALRE